MGQITSTIGEELQGMSQFTAYAVLVESMQVAYRRNAPFSLSLLCNKKQACSFGVTFQLDKLYTNSQCSTVIRSNFHLSRWHPRLKIRTYRLKFLGISTPKRLPLRMRTLVSFSILQYRTYSSTQYEHRRNGPSAPLKWLTCSSSWNCVSHIAYRYS